MKHIKKLEKKAIKLLSRLKGFTKDQLSICFDPMKLCVKMDGVYFNLCIEYKDKVYYKYDLTDRGGLLDLTVATATTTSKEEALYWILESYIWSTALKYEFKHRIRYIDSRRLAFSTKQTLFDRMGEPFASKCRVKIEEVLMQHPYNDEGCAKLDILKDFEELASMMKAKDGPSEEWPPDCQIFIKTLTEQHYRNSSGGIANFENVFHELLTLYQLASKSLEDNKNLQFEIANLMSQIDLTLSGDYQAKMIAILETNPGELIQI